MMRTRTRIGGTLAGSALLVGALAMATLAPALAQDTDGVEVAEATTDADSVEAPACDQDCPYTEEDQAERWAERLDRRAEHEDRRAEHRAENGVEGAQRGMGMGQGRDGDRPGRGAGGDAVQRHDGSMLEEGAVRPGRGPADGIGRGLGTGDCLTDAA